MTRIRYLAALAVAPLFLGGCASTQTIVTPDPRDPFESVNRSTYAFNEGLDRTLVKPVAKTYERIVPKPVQTGVSNFFSNAKYPVTLVNNILQAKFTHAANDVGRLLLNSTLGLGGLLDPATRAGLDRNDEDFGQTLGKWGVPAGPYVMVPFLGPYTLRDGFGSLADDFAEPRGYITDNVARWSLWAGDKLDRRVRLLDADSVLERTGDSYAFIRSAYLQRREYQVKDGDVPAEDFADDFESEAEPSRP
jgi:phospholipid-binding lipoprotein MlaA